MRHTLKAYPHALVDILDPAEPWSAGEFVRLARAEIAKAHEDGRIPLLVGGTMLYFRLLTKGLAAAPPVRDELLQQLRLRASEQGWPSLHAQLQQLDPDSAARIGPEDGKRLERALGVVLQTGTSLTDWHRQQQPGLAPDWRLLQLTLEWPRDELYRRADLRLKAMLEDGLVEEVRTLHRRDDIGPQTLSMQAIGYRQVWQYLDGRIEQDELEQQIRTATHRHLRRQQNWLKRFEPLVRVQGSTEAAGSIRAWL